MLAPQFYSQLTVCPTCQGWGVEKTGKEQKKLPCKECGGIGIFLLQSEQTFIWGMPTFVNFDNRNKMQIVRIGVLVVCVILFFGLYYLITQIDIKIPTIKLPEKL